MKTGSDSVIALKDVEYSYDGVHRVLKGISFEAAKGERIVVLGHNGSGKSTLVKILGALQTPSQGACFICGYNSSDSASLIDIHKKVSVVFQNPESQIVGAIVEDDAAFAPENQGLPPSEIEDRVAWALGKTGLLHKRSTLSSSLSGGEKQRLALAGALAAKAVCLILDEPTAMLDPEGRAEVEETLRDIHASGMTIIQVTHRLEDIDDADRVLVLAGGQWIWQGDRDSFWRCAEGLGFDLPPLTELERRLAKKGFRAPSVTEALSRIVSSAFPDMQTGNDNEKNEALSVGTTGPEEDSFFEVRHLNCSFNTGTPLENKVLDDVSCLLPGGCWISVLGRTGSGKSTLIQHLNGVYPIQSGEIFIKGKALPRAGMELRELRRRVGLVFQSPEAQLFSPTVREELAFAPRNWGFSEEEINLGTVRALESVGLDESYAGRNPLRLSGGERRLVAIASVLSADPDCLVLDEPTAGLDVNYRKKVVTLLSRLREEKKTVVTVTHDLEMAFSCSDRLLVLNRGLLLCEGSVRAVLPRLAELPDYRSMLPDILRITSDLRRCGYNVPLTWDAEELCGILNL